MSVKESELPEITEIVDADYIRIVTSSGESKKIALEDLKEALSQ